MLDIAFDVKKLELLINDGSDKKSAILAINKDYLENSTTHSNKVAALILTNLLTPKKQPADGMGWSGAMGVKASELREEKVLFQSSQSVPLNWLSPDRRKLFPVTKDANGTEYAHLCVDHSAMLFPSDEMMTWVFKGTLFGLADGTGFDFFGDYDIEKCRAKNAKYTNGDKK